MTANQIAYWSLEEQKRTNKAKEDETTRHNKMSEDINLVSAIRNPYNVAAALSLLDLPNLTDNLVGNITGNIANTPIGGTTIGDFMGDAWDTVTNIVPTIFDTIKGGGSPDSQNGTGVGNIRENTGGLISPILPSLFI